ncbi:hypothetical protein BDR04DRAFT_1102465 [Suillus decipiens]|nr:hypothetical protein BDR04DRAFT_1102465 [Suillus decipiens]
MDGTEIYTGQLSGKSKSELEDITTALSLLTEGTKSEILGCIKEHLENTPDLRQDRRFSGLYPSHGNRVPHDSDSHTGSSRIDHTTQTIPSQQLVPSINYGSHTGAPFLSQAAQQMNGPLPFPSFNPLPAYPLHYPGSELRFMQPVPAPSEARPLRTSPVLPPQPHAGPSTGRYMPYLLHGFPAH